MPPKKNTGYAVPALLNRINHLIAEVKLMGDDGRMDPDVAAQAIVKLASAWRIVEAGRVAYRNGKA